MPNYPLPSFLAPRAEHEQNAYEHEEYEHEEYELGEYEQQSSFVRELRDTSGLLKASIFTLVVAVSGIALALSLGTPVRVMADATASLSDSQPGPGPRAAADTPPVQSSADARPSASVSGAALSHEELAALTELTSQVRPENNAASPGALLEQFQAWAAKQDAQTQAPVLAEETVQPPVQAAPVQIARDEPAPEEPVQRHGTASALRNAHAEMPHVQKPRAKIRRAASRQAAPIQDAHALQQPVQTTQQPSFMQTLGWNQ